MYKEKFYTEELENIIEEIVFEQLYKIIEEDKLKFCQCNICMQDIAAIVLNDIPPRYMNNIVDKKFPGQEETKNIEKTKEEARQKLIAAIEKIIENPHCS